MSTVILRKNLKKEFFLYWSFEIENGLIGIKRDRFLLLLGFVHFDTNDNKTRNV
jgi:hypothetical protein